MIVIQMIMRKSLLYLLVSSFCFLNDPVQSTASEIGHPNFLSPHSNPITLLESKIYVVNTPADTLDVISMESKSVIHRIQVGVDPVSVIARPDGREVWVANHVSDSINVIDTDPVSPTYHQILATIQDIDPETLATRFDEPVGIAFADNEKAYVALSSENEIAVIDVSSRRVTKRIKIPAQDPRSIIVRDGMLYVIPFESNNQTQLSGGTGKIDGELVTFNAWTHSITVNNVLSIGHVVDIVKHPGIPDKDLFIYNTQNDELVEVVDTLGTLLYGMTVDSQGSVFIAQTDARNDVNGRTGTRKHSLIQLQNRAFLNRITKVSFPDNSEPDIDFFDLEPLPPQHPDPGMALATPFAIQISEDDSTLVATAAGSDQLFTVNADTGDVLGRVRVEAVPEGLVLESSTSGKPIKAWTLNAAVNSVSEIDLSDLAQPKLVSTIPLQDPTHPDIKRGRIAFETAAASSTGTFSCASCHPNGHTDQLLWTLKTPVVTGGNQIMPRLTMPIRGLMGTEPYHWDGVPGDPYGGINSASVYWETEPNSERGNPESSARHLVDGGLASTMLLKGDTSSNDEGKAGLLTADERDAMSKFILGIPYPPAQKRAYNNELSQRAKQGFELFHIKGHLERDKPRPNVCGDCHRMPFWVSTNTPGSGMDAPTWRGAYDRWMILPQGRLNIIDFDFYKRLTKIGTPERNVWQFSWQGQPRFDPVWDMVLEGSSGHSGSFARQVTLNRKSYDDGLTLGLMGALEESATEGAVILRVDGTLIDGACGHSLSLEFQIRDGIGLYVDPLGEDKMYQSADLINMAANGKFVGTFTGRIGNRVDYDHPQPMLWTLGPIEKQRGRQIFPRLRANKKIMEVSGRYIEDEAHLIVDGRRVEGEVLALGETVEIRLEELPNPGIHFIQVQNPDGLFSNEFIFHVDVDTEGNNKKQLSLNALD